MDTEKKTPADRLFETKHGLKSVPATQKGVPLQDYFQNAQLPEALKRFEVYVTDTGPVLEEREPMAWSVLHDQKIDEIVGQARASIEQNGYYLKRALNQAQKLARQTALSKDDVFDKVLARFEERYGEAPGAMVKEWRRARNLSVEDRDGPQSRPTPEL